MWYQNLGLNAAVFATLLIPTIFIYKKEARKSPGAIVSAAIFFCAAVSTALTGITFSKVMYYISLIVFLSFAQMPSVRMLFFALLSFISNIPGSIKANLRMIKDAFIYPFSKNKNGEKIIKKEKIKKILGRITAAGIIVLVFLVIFLSANAQFKKLWSNIFEPIGEFISTLWAHFAFFDTLHFLFIFYFLSLFLIPLKQNSIADYDNSRENNFKRKKTPFYEKGLSMKLKDEYKTGLLSIVSVNLLLLLVNITDIFSVWAGKVPETGEELSSFVHQGTYLLILSVLISIGIILYFFRDNLNIFSKNKNLKIAANIWILQNAFLLLSVGLRNIHYIFGCGLTYKRIGVFIFLLTTGIALIFLFLKIKEKKTFYYYTRTCAWSVLGLLVLFGFFNWDLIISNYNIMHLKGNTDYKYLEDNLSKQAYAYIYDGLNINDYSKVKEYISTVNNYDWQSFNFGDYFAVKKLTSE
jgi:hypothetical protein